MKSYSRETGINSAFVVKKSILPKLLVLALMMNLSGCGGGSQVGASDTAVSEPVAPAALRSDARAVIQSVLTTPVFTIDPPPFSRVTLPEIGAVGDNITDDTEALTAAFKRSAQGVCLDGLNRTYRVTGTLRADGNLCLINTRLRQMIKPVDTRPYILSAGRTPPVMIASDPAQFYPEDPVLTDVQDQELELRNNLRTILVTANHTGVVYLRGVHVSRGDHETLGNGGNAAGIWVADSPSVKMYDIEVFGKGRGHGIFVTGSQNIVLGRLNIHDLLWSSVRGDRLFTVAQIRDLYDWNNVPLYAYDPNVRKFGVVRSQEQTNGLVITHSENISVKDSSIVRVLYNAQGTYIPWQADGITMGYDRNVEIARLNINLVWEGIDFTGVDGVSSFNLTDLTIKNTLNYGLKLTHNTNAGVVDRVNISYSGINGIVVAGPVHDIEINHATILETGILLLQNGTPLSPYQANGLFRQNTAGIGISTNAADPANNPMRIQILNSTAENIKYPGLMRFGFLSDLNMASQVVLNNFQASGYTLLALGV